MLQRCSMPKALLILLGVLFFSSGAVLAESSPALPEQDHFYLDKIQLASQQIDLLEKRLAHAKQQFHYLRHQHEKDFMVFAEGQANKALLDKAGLYFTSAQSHLDGINVELTDSQQALAWLEKNIQEINNQLSVFSIFGLKIIHGDAGQVQSLRAELHYQENLYQLEKQRLHDLLALQAVEHSILQLYHEQYTQVNALLKSRKLLHIQQQAVKSEHEFQQQQNYWLAQLDTLYATMRSLPAKYPPAQYAHLENEILYAHENVHMLHLKTLIARYQDQLRQIRLSIARTNSITLLNSLNDQAQALGAQVARVDSLVNYRLALIKKQQAVVLQESGKKTDRPQAALLSSPSEPLIQLEHSYAALQQETARLSKRLADFRLILDKSVQQELSARQGLPGFSARAWLDLGREALLVPTLSFQLIKGFIGGLLQALRHLSLWQWLVLMVFEIAAVLAFSFIRKMVLRWLQPASGQAPQVFSVLLLRHLLPVALMGNAWLLFYGLAVPQFDWLIDFAAVWLLFRIVLTVAKTGLLESMHDAGGHDARLYHRLKAILMIGAVITGLTAVIHHLPLIYEIKDLFDRLFLAMLLILSLLILRSWRVVPHLIFQYMDQRRTYLRRLIYFLGIFIPSLLFINSLIGLFGFINLVGIISWYEGIFTLVLVAYLLLRIFLSESMERLSHLVIRYVSHGWLWTEAFLKPIHKILHLLLFLGAWTLLFVLYGWNQQSPVVERLNKLLHYPIVDVLNTTIRPISIFELIFAIALFYWAARWTRELVYRWLLSKTSDLGIRNSMAILSQYAVVIIGALLCLRLLGIDLHALFLVASGLLIAISFGLRDLVNNFACGLMLLFERPIRVGDIVCVNDHEGNVTHIGSRAVIIRTWDHMEIIVPNTELFNKSFINWTVQDNIVRTVITIKIDRQDDPSAVQKLIYTILKEHHDVLKDPEPEVFLKDMVDNHTEFEIRYYINVRQVSSRVAVRSTVLLALWQVFAQQGIKVPHPQHEIFIKNRLLPEGGN